MNAVESKPIQLPRLLQTIDNVMAESGTKVTLDAPGLLPVVPSPEVEIGNTANMVELNNLLNDDAMTGLITDAAQSVASNIALMKSAITTKSDDDVQRLAHTIKGMSASLGAIRLAEEASFIQENIDDLDQIEAFLPNFEATAEQTIAWWQQFALTKQRKLA